MRAVVPSPLAGERLDRAVSMLTGVSRAEAVAAVAGGSVTVNGLVVTAKSRRLAEGDVVEAPDPPEGGPTALLPDPSVQVACVHVDDDLYVVDKPPGLVVHPGSGHASGTLVQGLLAMDPGLAGVGDPSRPGIVHRLDKDTSGLLVVARTAEAYAGLTADLAARRVDRRYLALVWGHPGHDRGVIDAPVGRSAHARTRMAVVVDGRQARTHYRVLWRRDSPAVSLLACRLETGRTHQVRVHLDAIGHPVVGDGRYGGRREGLRVRRQFLHAHHLAFAHPRTGARMQFDSAPAADLMEVLDDLGEVVPADANDDW